MHIIHAVSSIEAEAAGTSYAISRLCQSLAILGHRVSLCSLGEPGCMERHGYRDNRFARRRFPYRLGRSPAMYRWLKNEVTSGGVDVVHSHGIWMMPNVYPDWATRANTIPLVISPHGMLSEWALRRSRAVKWVFWNILQKWSLTRAAFFHATAENEYAAIRRLGFRQPVAIVPNGIDLPVISTRMREFESNERTLLFLSRLHPSKGVDMLLRAWARLQDLYPEWRLDISGPGDARYVLELQGLAKSLATKKVRFAGALYGADKERAYQSADLFVLPTYTENFGIVVAEALASGCPVITTKGAPWAGLIEHRAGWWIDIGVESLQIALHEAMAQPPETLQRMGVNGRTWMERDFGWDGIGQRMADTYRWIVSGADRPGWVRIE